eukprot:TRINITY_DN8639_c0_g1_i1.p1 TRINITY_DN8639_c0_g1~~TRINITY_DN8639_c0_g1_i1.p1  ORF type:complete len:608 (-),score=122.90 TRINITY_DN8639_c0_g1_i1:78-1901(-)
MRQQNSTFFLISIIILTFSDYASMMTPSLADNDIIYTFNEDSPCLYDSTPEKFNKDDLKCDWFNASSWQDDVTPDFNATVVVYSDDDLKYVIFINETTESFYSITLDEADLYIFQNGVLRSNFLDADNSGYLISFNGTIITNSSDMMDVYLENGYFYGSLSSNKITAQNTYFDSDFIEFQGNFNSVLVPAEGSVIRKIICSFGATGYLPVYYDTEYIVRSGVSVRFHGENTLKFGKITFDLAAASLLIFQNQIVEIDVADGEHGSIFVTESTFTLNRGSLETLLVARYSSVNLSSVFIEAFRQADDVNDYKYNILPLIELFVNESASFSRFSANISLTLGENSSLIFTGPTNFSSTLAGLNFSAATVQFHDGYVTSTGPLLFSSVLLENVTVKAPSFKANVLILPGNAGNVTSEGSFTVDQLILSSSFTADSLVVRDLVLDITIEPTIVVKTGVLFTGEISLGNVSDFFEGQFSSGQYVMVTGQNISVAWNESNINWPKDIARENGDLEFSWLKRNVGTEGTQQIILKWRFVPKTLSIGQKVAIIAALSVGTGIILGIVLRQSQLWTAPPEPVRAPKPQRETYLPMINLSSPPPTPYLPLPSSVKSK